MKIKTITFDDFDSIDFDETKWGLENHINDNIVKEGDYLEVKLNDVLTKYLFINNELCKYFWDGSNWIFLSKELYSIT